MNSGKHKKIKFWAIFWSILYLLFFLWMQLWIAMPGVLLILDRFYTHIIPWKKIKEFFQFKGPGAGFLEWSAAILFALFLTVTIKTLFVEAYKIPTPSMEKTLMVGDYLFVSKLAYGPKLPNTPLAAPFMPNLLPNGKTSYSTSIQKPYKRLKGISKVKRNDIIVFNFPEGDTVVVQYSGQNYYSLVRQYGREYITSRYDLVFHPVDMRDNYIKRCVGLPGDTLKITNGKVWVNNNIIPEFPSQQFKYYVRTTRNKLEDSILNKLGVSENDLDYNPNNSLHTFPVSNEDVEMVRNLPQVQSLQRFVEPRISFKNTAVFPQSINYRWTADNFGTLLIPGKGISLDLDTENIDLYKRIIEVYEKNKLEIRDGEIYINNVLSRSYTFRMNYYFVLGDNRHNSADSRTWGFVPENHLVGKAVWIWFSRNPDQSIFKGLRFNRMFKKIK